MRVHACWVLSCQHVHLLWLWGVVLAFCLLRTPPPFVFSDLALSILAQLRCAGMCCILMNRLTFKDWKKNHIKTRHFSRQLGLIVELFKSRQHLSWTLAPPAIYCYPGPRPQCLGDRRVESDLGHWEGGEGSHILRLIGRHSSQDGQVSLIIRSFVEIIMSCRGDIQMYMINKCKRWMANFGFYSVCMMNWNKKWYDCHHAMFDNVTTMQLNQQYIYQGATFNWNTPYLSWPCVRQKASRRHFWRIEPLITLSFTNITVTK